LRIPKTLAPLLEEGLIDHVIQPLRSGKEADLFVVATRDGVRCAKVYKEARQRSFRQAGLYQEGRTVRNSRRSRAMSNGTRYGRREQEEVWQSAEVAALFALAEAQVRVPRPYLFLDGVLLMELIVDDQGNAAPRLADVELTEQQAHSFHQTLITNIARMLCAGIVHGDLSEYNILIDATGPVIIDLPQSVNASANNNAAAFFVRDIDHIATFFGRFAPTILKTDYGREMWVLYKNGTLRPDTPLTGRFVPEAAPADVAAVLREIDAARVEEEWRRARL
jgi:RIO kinase 1